MTLRKLFALLLGMVVLFGTTAVVMAGEKPAAKPKQVTGIVKSVLPESLVVEKGKKEWAFAISGEVADAAQKLKAGERVTVAYTVENGKMTATKVTAKTARAAKKTAEPGAAKGSVPEKASTTETTPKK